MVAAIYASAYPVQFVLDFLRAHNLLRLSIAAIALVVSSRCSSAAAWSLPAAAEKRALW